MNHDAAFNYALLAVLSGLIVLLVFFGKGLDTALMTIISGAIGIVGGLLKQSNTHNSSGDQTPTATVTYIK